MKRWTITPLLVAFFLLALPTRSPAPLVFRPGEGWSYEPVGGEGKWQRGRAKDQLDVAQTAFNKADYSLALKAARRVVRQWPLSDYAPAAQYLVGRCCEAKRQDEKAFNEYQRLIEKYPKVENYQDVLQRQYEIAGRFLAGQWFKAWGYIPWPPSMTRTVEMYQKIIRNGPYSAVAPLAQLRIGAASEKKHDYPDAVRAYELAADRYNDQPRVASTALYSAGMAYNHQSKKAEYDQSTAGQAIATLTDFLTIYPNDPRGPSAQKAIAALKREQARGSFDIAQYYEKRHRWAGALVYYNDVTALDPTSPQATAAREKIDALKKRINEAAGK